MAIDVRALTDDETSLIEDFTFEAIFVPDGMEPPSREILKQPELKLYYEGFGTRAADLALAAVEDGKVVGVVWVRRIDDYGHLDDSTPSLAIALLDGWRGRGIGTILMRRMLELLRENGFGQVSLSVQKANRALDLYRRLGFTTVEERDQDCLMVRILKEGQT